MSPGYRYVDVDGIRTGYVETGEGSPLLMVHGGDFRSFAHSSDWDLNVEGLASLGFRVIAMDKLGQGHTDNPPDEERYSIDAVYEHLEGFVSALGLGKFAICGHSRGALPSTLLALEHPDLLNALVIVDSNTISPRPTPAPSDFYERAYAGMTDLPESELIDREVVMNSFSIEHLTPEYHRSRLEVAQGAASIASRRLLASPDALAAFHAGIDRLRERVLERLSAGELQTDTLVIWGRDDPSAPVEIARTVHEMVSRGPEHRAELHIFNQSGHYSYREHPQRFNDVLGAFALHR